MTCGANLSTYNFSRRNPIIQDAAISQTLAQNAIKVSNPTESANTGRQSMNTQMPP
eukprot:CAMPEP_0172505348 /NCGR_PEP_ID=MMETSP1066-20121228/185743_1 /TAXON_ID=671091 /ORGANISM="Coscinodiscus wailesii, Strain CCMP2513" /LENGTH=55 /DNA_ID=CAMNT_0013281923 /DNA_START=113 /DNA_END=278 /DNA_ORIENTATION=+